jgi:hypothetical protein
MDGAYEMRGLRVVEFEAELAFDVGLGASGLFHALGEFEQDDIIARGGLAGGCIFYGAGESLSGGE